MLIILGFSSLARPGFTFVAKANHFQFKQASIAILVLQKVVVFSFSRLARLYTCNKG
jgi:hypothetical protein